MKQDYYGIKRVTAWPEIKNDQEGYAVVYKDGYRSWSPKHTFEAAYQPVTRMSFSAALEALKAGAMVAREGWNGKGMFLFLVKGSSFQTNREPWLSLFGEGVPVSYHAHIDMKTANGDFVPWLASQTDMLADDWTIVEVA